MKREERFE